jgi:SAM-dependent methyltransferase
LLDLSIYPLDDGVHLLSPPQRFEGGEAAYDAQIGGGGRPDMLRGGAGAWALVQRHARRGVETLLEIGAGGGTCSLGLVASAPGVTHVITDTSPVFLRMVRAKLAAFGLHQADTRLMTLAGEDLSLLPANCLDAIVIASALHHVGDWRGFLRAAAERLRPGGVLVIQEPCREGNLMMAMALDVVLSPLWPESAALNSADAAKLGRCRDSIYFLANGHIEKIGEDKHSFLVSELAREADEAGFVRSAFYANAHFSDLAESDLAAHRGACSFLHYMDSFLEHHHRVSPDGMARLRSHLFPVLQHLDAAFQSGDGPPLLGCMVFCA